ncbi:hypothetical protein OAP63_05935 [Vibrio sp.]|nr:hypothetical protein [Vibrio sp.]
MAIFRRLRKSLWLLISLVLLILNIATIVNAKFYDFLFDMASHITPPSLLTKSKSTQVKNLRSERTALSRQNKLLVEERRVRKAKFAQAKTISKRISRRVVKTVGVNMSSIIGESIPYIGIGVILSVTASDIYDGCQTIKDTNQLLTLFGEENEIEHENEVCGMTIPSLDDVKNKIFWL